MRKLKTIKIDLSVLLNALEGGGVNPDCYAETGSIRAKFREQDKQLITIHLRENDKDVIQMVFEETETFPLPLETK